MAPEPTTGVPPSPEALGTLRGVEATERFRALASQPEASVPLDEAALLIAAHAYPDLDIGAEMHQLDALADGCFAPTLDALVRYLFVDLRFKGNHNEYYDPRNSYPQRGRHAARRHPDLVVGVGHRDRSSPRRSAWPVSGCPVTSCCVTASRTTCSSTRSIGGAVLDRAGCERAFRRVQGDDAPFDPSYLEPVGSFAILTRMLANLRAIFAAVGDHQALLWVIRLRAVLPDAAPEARGELAAALAATGAFGEAADELDALAAELGGTLGTEYSQRASGLRARLN